MYSRRQGLQIPRVYTFLPEVTLANSPSGLTCSHFLQVLWFGFFLAVAMVDVGAVADSCNITTHASSNRSK